MAYKQRTQILEAHADRLVLQRCFSDLMVGQAAKVLNGSLTRVERTWRYALAWPRRERADAHPGDGAPA